MEYLPLVFDIKKQPCLLVGGGAVAYRKASLLARAGAVLSVVAPSIEPRLQALVKGTGGAVYIDTYNARYLADKHLVIAASNDHVVNTRVASDCRQRGMLINIVDTPQHSNVIFPAIIDRDPLLIAVSSSGSAPVLARSVRTKIESSVPANLGDLARFIGERRKAVRGQLSEQQLHLFWGDVIESEIAESVMAGRIQDADKLFVEALASAVAGTSRPQGEVYLVGAGPGDPDLLTFKALRLMQRADIVLYDRLVNPAIVDLCRRDAERVYVGKKNREHPIPQNEINQMLIDYAKAGNKVLRLKGGDPFVFGRGGEEISGLAEQQIPFQIVPGISAANGCACYAGIPLTHRDHAQSVRFVTGHLKDDSTDLPWPELVADSQTVVIYMGLVGLPIICRQLVAHGASPKTPVALIEQGTTPQQRVHTGTLETIVQQLSTQEVHAPTLVIIGSVVSLHESLAWL